MVFGSGTRVTGDGFSIVTDGGHPVDGSRKRFLVTRGMNKKGQNLFCHHAAGRRDKENSQKYQQDQWNEQERTAGTAVMNRSAGAGPDRAHQTAFLEESVFFWQVAQPSVPIRNSQIPGWRGGTATMFRRVSSNSEESILRMANLHFILKPS